MDTAADIDGLGDFQAVDSEDEAGLGFLFASDEEHRVSGPAAADSDTPAGADASAPFVHPDADEAAPLHSDKSMSLKGALFATHVYRDDDKGPRKQHSDGTSRRVLPKRNTVGKFDPGLTAYAADYRAWNTVGAAFENFIDPEIVTNMWTCTSECMLEKNGDWPLLLLSELYDVLAIQVAMGLSYQPSIESYWDTKHTGTS